jgi:predicted HAD superfamily Cof-like phosphohydrolase
MMETNFNKVEHYNNLIGNHKGDIKKLDKAAISAQLNLIKEEFDELCESVALEYTGGIRDAIADVLVTVYGLAHRMGIDADKDFNAVHKSNMSKFCINAEEVIETVEKCSSIGLTVYTEGQFPEVSIKSYEDQEDVNGKFYPKGKQLKSVNWKEPTFEQY